jgi:hypothetical protein
MVVECLNYDMIYEVLNIRLTKTDVDECSNNSYCSSNGHCVNTVGSFYCQCDNGYTSDDQNCVGMYG